ncbi:MAG: glycosyl transferase family 36 [candidate division KSB1 bacterium]|nr:glycosyl transferase family 36 [candidate division KSB1 bacterium]
MRAIEVSEGKGGMQKYGAFSEDRKEFVITRPDTPRPWVNYISNGRYTGLVSHTGGGFSFCPSPRDDRITRWRYNSLPIDRPGRYLYVRDRKTGKYWSPTWQPTMSNLESFRCHHGVYYTRIVSACQGIQSQLLYFVPPDDDLEVWHVVLRNSQKTARELDLFAYVELCLGHALVDLINQPNDQHFNEVHFDRQAQILYATKRYWVRYGGPTVKQANAEWDKVVFFASSLPVIGWDGSKDLFIGRWRSEADPEAVERGLCNNSEITSGDAVAALHTQLMLEGDEEREFVVLLGVVPKQDYLRAGAALVHKYRDVKVVKAEFQRVIEEWQDYLSAVQVFTPDDDLNTMVNVWNQYQTSVTFRFSRDASYYHGGLLFGRGFRDSCQDTLGPVIARPAWVRERLLEMCRAQFADGSAFHLIFPGTGTGERTGHADTPLWLPFAVAQYLKETADFTLLDVAVPFADQSSASVLRHALLAVDYVLSNLSPRGLAKFGPGDWNDTLDYLGRAGKGESVWVSMFLAYVLKEIVELLRFVGRREDALGYEQAYERLCEAINQHCWDGEWYIRGTNDWGEVIGSARNREGRIFLNTQSWAVISGVAPRERALQCMEAVRVHLDTPKGPKILHPPYRTIDPHIGLATRCVAGKKENGSVFNHTVSWAILAECILGRAERAFDLYKRALPMNPVVDIDRYEIEPYVYAEYVTSPDHPTYGQASHSWLTGSSAWMLRDVLDYILGVRPTYQGLLIDPCVPAGWASFRVHRRFRGHLLDVEVLNPDHVNSGVLEVEVAGKPLSGNLIDFGHEQVVEMLCQKERVPVRVRLGHLPAGDRRRQ